VSDRRTRPLLELYQTEWCPASRRIRQRLTELGVDFVARQVPVEKEERLALRAATGEDVIPALVLGNGDAIVGEAGIEDYLDRRFEKTPGSEAHRVKAARARQRELEEAAPCLKLGTR
jgi:glutathione S-transferase